MTTEHKPWEDSLLPAEVLWDLEGVAAITKESASSLVARVQAERSWKAREAAGQLPETTPDVEWLVRNIKAFGLPAPVGTIEGLANHLVRNWLMVEQARNQERERVLVELRDICVQLEGELFVHGMHLPMADRIDTALAHAEELGL